MVSLDRNQVVSITGFSTLYNKTTGTITSTFNSQAFSNSTDLSWARTMLHEAVHAYLVAFYAVDRPTWIATYPEMVEDWDVLQNWNDVHHEEYARSIVNEIALSLQEFGDSRGYNNLDLNYYKDLAWGGLEDTSAFMALSPSEQQRIKDIIRVELTKKDSDGNIKSQKGTDAGC